MNSERTANSVPSLQVKSNAGDNADVILWGDPATHRLLVDVISGGGSSITDDAAFTVGTSSLTVAGGIYRSTRDAVNDGDAGAFAMTANRAQYVTVETPNGDSAMDDTNDSIKVTITADNVGIGGGTQYAEDSAHSTGNIGTMALAVRRDTPGNLSDTDGDYEPLQVASGRLWTSTILTGDALTSLQLLDNVIIVDDAAFTPGTSSVAMVGATYDDSTPDSVNEGDAGALRMSGRRELYVQIRDAAGNERGLNIDASGRIAATTVTAGDVAHDSADSGNPVKIGAKATNNIEGLTQVASGDRTDIIADLNGAIINRPYTTLEEIITERVSDTGGSSTAFSNFAAGGSGIHNYITTIAVYNASATDGFVDFRDGTGGAVIFTAPAPATGGSVITFPVPLKFSANTAVAYDVSGALTTVYISLVGFQAQG